MNLTIPFIGTVLSSTPICVTGDPQDPIRPAIDLGNVSWHRISINVEMRTMTLEVKAGRYANYPAVDTGGNPILDDAGIPQMRSRPATLAEKAGYLKHAKGLVKALG